MKKVLKLSSLAIVLMALLTLTACAPKADKAEEKMEKAGYFSIDAKAIVGTETSKYENFFVFAKGDNAINAAANMLTGGDFVVALYYKDAEEAKKAYDKKEIPVGAVIVKDDKVIAKAHNLKELKNDTTKHAEIIAIQKASKKLNSWRLENCEMYVTLEPCSMCAGALIQSRIKKVYIGTMDYKTGACGSVLNLLKDFKFNHIVEVENGVMQQECEEILRNFFKELRKSKKKKIQ